MNMRSKIYGIAGSLVLSVLAACGGGGGDSAPSSFTIGGTVTGLAAGTQIVLKDNGVAALTVTANGAFTFVQNVDANGSYAVTADTQPAGQTCTVSSGAGAGVTANVASVQVTCSPVTFTVSATVTGLAAGQSVSLVNGTDVAGALTFNADGSTAFATRVAYNSGYSVTVGTQPANQTCTVSGGAGAGVTGNVAVNVTCSANPYTISAAVSGLVSGQQVTLVNNGDTNGALTFTADATTAFAAPVAFNSAYAITIGTQPTNETCTIASNGAAAGITGNATATVTCSPIAYTVSATVAGLIAGQQVTLVNNGDTNGALGFTADGTTAFATPVAFNSAYAVTIGTQPTNETCTIATNGSAAGITGNVTATVTCSPTAYTVSATVSGLIAGQQVTLLNNGDTNGALTFTADGTTAFAVPVAFNSMYAITIGTQPTNETCTIATNGSAAGITGNVTATVTCSPISYTVSAAVSGLVAGQQVTLVNNGDTNGALTFTADGTTAFATPVAFNSAYAVTIGTQPANETCTIATNGSSANIPGNVTATVTCSTTTYPVSVTVTGLAANQQVTLVNNNDTNGNISFTADGTTAFATPVNFNAAYGVTVSTSPTAETCRITGGSGTVAGNTAVTVICRLALAYVTDAGAAIVPPADATSLTTAGSVLEYQIGVDGTLTSIGTIATGVNPNVVTVDPSGRFAYVANFNDGTISQYSIDATTGALTSLGAAVHSGTSPYGLAIDKTSSYLYATNQADDTVSQFQIGASGALTLIGGATPVAAVATGTTPYGITVDPSGHHVYVANRNSNNVSQYMINGDGSLVAMMPATMAAGTGPLYVTIDPAGVNAYVTDFNSPNSAVTQFTFDANGGLVVSTNAPATTGDGSYPLAIAPNGLYAYVADKYQNYLESCTFGANGALACGPVSGSVTQPQYTAVDPFSRNVFVVDYSGGTGSGAISQFTIGTNGALSTPTFVTTPAGPFAITTTR